MIPGGFRAAVTSLSACPGEASVPQDLAGSDHPYAVSVMLGEPNAASRGLLDKGLQVMESLWLSLHSQVALS